MKEEENHAALALDPNIILFGKLLSLGKKITCFCFLKG